MIRRIRLYRFPVCQKSEGREDSHYPQLFTNSVLAYRRSDSFDDEDDDGLYINLHEAALIDYACMHLNLDDKNMVFRIMADPWHKVTKDICKHLVLHRGAPSSLSDDARNILCFTYYFKLEMNLAKLKIHHGLNREIYRCLVGYDYRQRLLGLYRRTFQRKIGRNRLF